MGSSLDRAADRAANLTNGYHPDGLRHQRTDISGTTQVIWDGDDPLAQVDGSGHLVQYWNWGGAGGQPGVQAPWSLRLVKSRYPTTSAHPDQ